MWGSRRVPNEIVLPHNWTPREYQVPAWNALMGNPSEGIPGVKRADLVWHRRAGKDDFAINFTAASAMQRVGTYWHMLPFYKQGRQVIWDGITGDATPRRFRDAFPPEIIEKERDDEMCRWLRNGSLWRVVGADNVNALMGTNPIGIVFSEFSLMDPDVLTYLAPILAQNGGWAVFIYTPRGKNHAYRLHQNAMLSMAKGSTRWFSQTLTVEDTHAIGAEEIEEERKDKDPAIFNQEYFCVPPGALVACARGLMPIERVVIGDKVLTHTGRWRPVLETTARECVGDLVEITTFGQMTGRPLRVTADHRVRVLDPTTQRYSWKPAGDVKSGEFCVAPRPRLGIAVVPEWLAVLAAWYVTEGSCAKTAVQFSLNKTETAEAEEIERCLAAAGARNRRHELPTALLVQGRSTWLADLLARECGTGAANKRLPWTLLSGHETVFFERLMAGDGCEIRGGWLYTTVSRSLAADVQALAASLGLGSGVTVRRGGTATIEGRRVTVRESYAVRIQNRPSAVIRPAKNGIALRVKRVERVAYAGVVHNLHVQFDESYVAEGRVIHNCSFEAPLEGAYYGQLIVDMERDQRLTNVPYEPLKRVFTAWDLGIGDDTAIWFAQQVGREVRLIDYYENHGKGLDHYAKVLSEKPYAYEAHYAPHDINVREFSGKSRIQIAASLGIRFTVVPKLRVEDGIAASRALLPRIWADSVRCERGLQALREYRRIRDPNTGDWRDIPQKSWACHAADAFRYLAVGLKPERGKLAPLYPKLAIV